MANLQKTYKMEIFSKNAFWHRKLVFWQKFRFFLKCEKLSKATEEDACEWFLIKTISFSLKESLTDRPAVVGRLVWIKNNLFLYEDPETDSSFQRFEKRENKSILVSIFVKSFFCPISKNFF